jgi:hypothetical protein
MIDYELLQKFPKKPSHHCKNRGEWCRKPLTRLPPEVKTPNQHEVFAKKAVFVGAGVSYALNRFGSDD